MWKRGQSACCFLSETEPQKTKKKGTPCKRGALPAAKAEIRLWYFCGQTRNRRGFYHGDFHFGGPNRDRTDDLTDANRTLSQLSYGPILAIFHRKKL